MLRAQRDLTRPDEKTLQQYLERTEALLKELHKALDEPAKAALTAAMVGSHEIDQSLYWRGAVARANILWCGICLCLTIPRLVRVEVWQG